jgi:hypothetical protein
VLSRFSGEKRVHPACCRVFQAKNAFIRRVVAFFRRKTRSSGVLSRFSDEKHVFQPKIAFIH